MESKALNERQEISETDFDEEQQILKEISLESTSSKVSCCRRSYFLYGIFLSFLSGLIFSINSSVIQYLYLDYTEVLLVRSLIQLLFMTIAILSMKDTVWYSSDEESSVWTIRFYIGLQGCLSGIIICCSFACLSYMPLGDALTLLFSTPIFTMIFESIFPPKCQGILFKILSGTLLAIGLILVTQPPFIFGVRDFLKHCK